MILVEEDADAVQHSTPAARLRMVAPSGREHENLISDGLGNRLVLRAQMSSIKVLDRQPSPNDTSAVHGFLQSLAGSELRLI